MPETIGIIGDGGQADETESFSALPVAFRAVESAYLNENARVDVAAPGDLSDQPVVLAIGAPGLKKRLSEVWTGDNYTSVVSDRAYVHDSAKVGEGSIIAPGATITTNVTIGRHVLVNVDASIQHNSVVRDFVTIGPGARVAGNVVIGEGSFIGIGAVIIQKVTIGSGVVVGAGAVVTADLTEENGVYVGAPARLIRKNESWLNGL